MDRFKRTFTFRSKNAPTLIEKGSKPTQWNDDERKVREGTCSFQVKYLGSIEVFESRGMPVCEEAMKQLLKFKARKNTKRAVLYVSGDALRVTEEISKGLIVDQVIEKVSFCAPDKNHHRGFAYICRDAATRRWLCHGFKAVKESGERLSHAVGCAFAVCLERKQQRDKDSVDVTFNENKTSFTRLGSFRQASIAERLLDPQSVIIQEAIPNNTNSTTKSTDEQTSIPRPRASQSVLDRQSSLRIFPKLQDEQKNPFKRDYSVRVTDLSSNHDRKQLWPNEGSIKEESNDFKPQSPPTSHKENVKSLDSNNNINGSAIHQIINEPVINKKQGFDHVFTDDPFSAAPINPAEHIKPKINNQRPTQTNSGSSNMFHQSMRQPELARPLNNPPQQNIKISSNNNDHNNWPKSTQYRSFNPKNSASWSDNILKRVDNPNSKPAHNNQLCANSSHNNNPFDVSWVNQSSTFPVNHHNVNTNPFKT